MTNKTTTIRINESAREHTRFRMVERRARRGYNPEESSFLLSKLIREHEGENLAAALVYHQFATERNARLFAGLDG